MLVVAEVFIVTVAPLRTVVILVPPAISTDSVFVIVSLPPLSAVRVQLDIDPLPLLLNVFQSVLDKAPVVLAFAVAIDIAGVVPPEDDIGEVPETDVTVPCGTPDICESTYAFVAASCADDGSAIPVIALVPIAIPADIFAPARLDDAVVVSPPVMVAPTLVVSSFLELLWYNSTAAFDLAIIASSVAFDFINTSDARINKLPLPTSSI